MTNIEQAKTVVAAIAVADSADARETAGIVCERDVADGVFAMCQEARVRYHVQRREDGVCEIEVSTQAFVENYYRSGGTWGYN